MIIFRENNNGVIKNIVSDGFACRPDLKEKYGLAVDIGTTTVAAGLFNLYSGKCIDALSEKNRQCSLGRDVIMRMMHACNGRLNELQGMIISQIEDMAIKLCKGICELDKLYEISIVGNMAMCHFFLGKDVSALSKAPFIPSYKGSVSCFGRECGFNKIAGARIYVMSGVTAHVGADAVSFFGIGDIADKDKNILAIDIGTNAEIMLGCHGVGYACSAAAGPAFEGRGISCGIPACNGAISGVRIIRGSGNIILDIIAEQCKRPLNTRDKKINAKAGMPKGICGSGLVDLIAELRKQEFVDENGYLCSGDDIEDMNVYKKFMDNIVTHNGECCFMLCRDTDLPKEIYICQSDIRNFQMAKAAIQAGANCLLRETGTSIEDLDEVIIGGMFGSYISKKNAVSLGLFPDVPCDKIKVCGNLAGTGAAKALLDKEFRAETERLAGQIKHVELADNKEFENEFMDAMKLKEWV